MKLRMELKKLRRDVQSGRKGIPGEPLKAQLELKLKLELDRKTRLLEESQQLLHRVQEQLKEKEKALEACEHNLKQRDTGNYLWKEQRDNYKEKNEVLREILRRKDQGQEQEKSKCHCECQTISVACEAEDPAPGWIFDAGDLPEQPCEFRDVREHDSKRRKAITAAFELNMQSVNNEF
ncbi:uncharacterized protein I303_105774 [Kwoniella dejecticola CBS 10117]|uniref:Uncharacterized protein n=1 Tax=Kwoniella dejecticola CBS 10117 TaxID=1296121 RepID=A0A1A6A0E7_9TREE|nr:uncharacterized protein I303_05796 [Kwoniella dejecticola CBS 10117]OBR83516.1 hypothetical protein I303_05796 [Kwoniella dejecticola CBS 10117]